MRTGGLARPVFLLSFLCPPLKSFLKRKQSVFIDREYKERQRIGIGGKKKEELLGGSSVWHTSFGVCQTALVISVVTLSTLLTHFALSIYIVGLLIIYLMGWA